MLEENKTVVRRELSDEDILDVLIENGMIDAYYYFQDSSNRRFYLNDYVLHETVDGIVQQIIKINIDDMGVDEKDRKPIVIFLDTYGGDFYSGFKLIDVMESSKTPVVVVNMACCYSMGLYICMAGHKRYSLKNARFLLHDGDLGVQNSAVKVQDFIKFNDNMKDKEREYVISHSNISDEEYDTKMGHDWYMFADEAKELGIIDEIIGEGGVSLDDIFKR